LIVRFTPVFTAALASEPAIPSADMAPSVPSGDKGREGSARALESARVS
jgi:hypothetical protein